LVTGTPGVGKTSVSIKLASKLNAHYLGINDIFRKKKFFFNIDKERNTLIADTEKISNHLKNILKKLKGPIILEGHYVFDVVSKEDVNAVFVLRRDPRELKRVFEMRGYTEKKIWENLGAEILDVCLCDSLNVYDKDRVCEIDVTGKDVETVVKEILLLLERKQGFRIGNIDWLEMLENLGQLDDFLKKI
jgi:adenylate kinase